MSPLGLVAAAAASGIAAAGGPAILGVVVLVEAGVPIPLPGDIVVLVLGARVATGGFPVWAAVIGCELAAVIGTGALLLAAHGPGRVLVRRFGARVGLTEPRLNRVGALLRRRGAAAVITGRATPGLRTATVIAAGTSGLRLRWLFPLLLAGSTIFVQSHLVLGIVLGPAAEYALAHWTVPVAIGVAALLAGGFGVWAVRRGRRSAVEDWSGGACPLCLAVGALGQHVEQQTG